MMVGIHRERGEILPGRGDSFEMDASPAMQVVARMGDTRVDFHVRHGADISLASVCWGDQGAWNELLLSSRSDLGQSDALTRQYTAFHHELRGLPSLLAGAQDGAIAARRALAIVAKL